MMGFVLRYGAVGVLGGLIQETVLYVWIDVAGLSAQYLLGVVVGFFVSLAIVFPLQKFWTFRDDSTNRTRTQFFLYSVIAVASLLGNIFLMHLFVSILKFNPYFSQAITIMCVAGTSFLLNYAFTFKQHVSDIT